MTDFLEFLNTADLDTLTQIPGITRKTAGNIIAARPFDFVEDCAKVPGVGKNLLGRAQTYFEEELNDSPNNSLATVEPQSQPIVIESEHPEEENDDKPSFWSRLGVALASFLRALIRLILLVALIAGIGALLYYGLPYINRTFLAPVEQNTAQINKLEANMADLQVQLDEANTRITMLETSIETHTASLERLAKMQTFLEEQQATRNNMVALKLKQEITMTRALEMLGRGRLYLAQSNFGLAKEDIESARDQLAGLYNASNSEILGQVVGRLDLAIDNLPNFPVVASGDLEIAWEILMTGTMPNPLTEFPTSIPPLATFTLSPDVITTFTPTPFITPTP